MVTFRSMVSGQRRGKKLNSKTQLRRLTASAGHKEGWRAAEKARVKPERKNLGLSPAELPATPRVTRKSSHSTA